MGEENRLPWAASKARLRIKSVFRAWSFPAAWKQEEPNPGEQWPSHTPYIKTRWAISPNCLWLTQEWSRPSRHLLSGKKTNSSQGTQAAIFSPFCQNDSAPLPAKLYTDFEIIKQTMVFRVFLTTCKGQKKSVGTSWTQQLVINLFTKIRDFTKNFSKPPLNTPILSRFELLRSIYNTFHFFHHTLLRSMS